MTQLLLLHNETTADFANVADGINPGDPRNPRLSATHFVPDSRPLVECDKCGCISYRDQATHEGRSTVRECAFCGRFMGFPVWYGVAEASREPKAKPLAAEMGAA